MRRCDEHFIDHTPGPGSVNRQPHRREDIQIVPLAGDQSFVTEADGRERNARRIKGPPLGPAVSLLGRALLRDP